MESSSRTLVCSVLFLDIVEYSKKAVADQLQLKQGFNHLLSSALEEVPARDRIILDTGDGAAVTFMGDPEDALFAALTVRDAATKYPGGPLPVRLGVNLGPVRLVKDLNGQMNIIGDGINVAQRVMSFSRPGQLLVSRSFYEVVSCLSRDYMNLFRHEGSRTDKHVREHEVYSVVGAPATRRVAEAESAINGGSLRAWMSGTGPLGLRRSALVAAPSVFFAILGAGVAIALLSGGQESAVAAVPPKADAPRLVNASELLRAAPEKPAAVPVKAAAPEPRKAAEKKAVEKKAVEKRVERVAAAKPAPAPTPAPAPVPVVAAPASEGKVVVAISPWGEVFVDGRSRGVSPPIQSLDLPAGPHTIEIRNGTFPAHVEKIVVKPGEPVRIRHRFQ
ncbi:MAG TPA: adenylate/guanylate cyclase domain-containing protein [Burkholderiales bacterium]|nr:adenylate/guanylate cyclase domain-containing protein [Burkholderiales bacterium]